MVQCVCLYRRVGLEQPVCSVAVHGMTCATIAGLVGTDVTRSACHASSTLIQYKDIHAATLIMHYPRVCSHTVLRKTFRLIIPYIEPIFNLLFTPWMNAPQPAHNEPFRPP